MGCTGGSAAGHRGGAGPPGLGAYVTGWLLWGARLFGWAPDVTRAQRHGDLLGMSDLLLSDMERSTR